MEFLVGASVPSTPSEEELQAWLQANAENYLTPTQYRFRQVYFDPERGAGDLSVKVAAVCEQLISGEEPLAADPTLLPHALMDTTLPEVAGVFGRKFAAALEELAPGGWAEPVESEYGFHLVLIERIAPGHIPGLHDIRSMVESDYLYDKTERARDEFYHALRSRHSIEIEAGPVAAGDL
jgi:peptidyl-prolyl cis-trans isomerase C